MRTETIAKLCVAYSGVAWGLFWIPLHILGDHGFTAYWASYVFNMLPALIVLPLALWRWRQMRAGGTMLVATGIAMGLTQIFYSLSVVHTDVVRAITIFYLNPVWTALLARFLLGEKLGLVGLVSLGLAFFGMSLVLRTGLSLPLPQFLGDWFAIVAGFAWAASVILLRLQPHGEPLDLGMQSMLWTGLFLLPMPFLADMGAAPSLALIAAQLWWLLPFLILVLMTGVFTAMWAVPKLSPNLVTLIYMTEIGTAAITAALFADQGFTLQDAVGVALIALAGALSSLLAFAKDLTARRPA